MTLHAAFTILHVAAGSLALLSGLVPMLSAKGSKLRKRTGKVYGFSMLAVFLTFDSATVGLWHPA